MSRLSFIDDAFNYNSVCFNPAWSRHKPQISIVLVSFATDLVSSFGDSLKWREIAGFAFWMFTSVTNDGH